MKTIGILFYSLLLITSSYAQASELPAFFQKVNGKHLVSQKLEIPEDLTKAAAHAGFSFAKEEGDEKAFAYLDANCHSVTWQWINHIQGQASDEFLFTLVDAKELETAIAEAPIVAKKNLKSGDVILFEAPVHRRNYSEVIHSAVYIGNGEVFDKSNPGTENPYKITKLSDVIEAQAEFGGVPVYKRVSEMQTKLPNLREHLRIGNKKQVQELGAQFALESVPLALRNQYMISAEMDFETNSLIYTLIRLLTTDEAGPKDLISPLANQSAICEKLF